MRRQGFSLLEVLCALAVLSIGLVGVMEGITLSLRSHRESERLSEAALLASAHLELLRTETWITAGEEEGDFGDAFPGYRWRERIAETGLDGLYEVAVEVLDDSTGEVVYELHTRLFDMPLGEGFEEEERQREERESRRNRGGQARGS